MQTDTVRPAATVYFAARRIISELPIHRDTVLSHARDVDRAANELDGIEKLRARIARRASSGADTSQELAMIESALESAAWHATTFHKVALAAIDWAENSLLLLNAADSREMSRAARDVALALHRNGTHGFIGTSVGEVAGWVALFVDALKTATRESPPRHNEHPIDEHAIRAVVADQKWTIDRIRKVLPDETLVPLRDRADLEWKMVEAAESPVVSEVETIGVATTPEDMTAPERTPVAVSPSGRVKLFAPGESPVVDGVRVDRLTRTRYDVVAFLIRKGADGARKGDLQTVSGDAVNVLKKLAEKPKWADVISLAGVPGRGYRIL